MWVSQGPSAVEVSEELKGCKKDIVFVFTIFRLLPSLLLLAPLLPPPASLLPSFPISSRPLLPSLLQGQGRVRNMSDVYKRVLSSSGSILKKFHKENLLSLVE